MLAALGGFDGSDGPLAVIARGGLGGAFGLGRAVGSLVVGAVSDAAAASTAAAVGVEATPASTVGASGATALAAAAPRGSASTARGLAAREAAHAAPPRTSAKRPSAATMTFAWSWVASAFGLAPAGACGRRAGLPLRSWRGCEAAAAAGRASRGRRRTP